LPCARTCWLSAEWLRGYYIFFVESAEEIPHRVINRSLQGEKGKLHRRGPEPLHEGRLPTVFIADVLEAKREAELCLGKRFDEVDDLIADLLND